jgi:peroxiredoxin
METNPVKPDPLLPREPVPALDVALTTGGRYTLGESPGAAFDLLVAYRGLHCPLCAKYLLELERLEPEFRKRGVQVIAVSGDDEDRARQMVAKVNASGVMFGEPVRNFVCEA